MFFDERFVSSKTLKRVWKSANNQPEADSHEDCYLPIVCDRLDRWMRSDNVDPRSRLSLRSSAALIGGTAKIYQQKMKQLCKDVCKLDEDVMFRKRGRYVYSEVADSDEEEIDFESIDQNDSDEEDNANDVYQEFSDKVSRSPTSKSTSERLEEETNTNDSNNAVSPQNNDEDEQLNVDENQHQDVRTNIQSRQESLSNSLNADVLEEVVTEVMAENQEANSSSYSETERAIQTSHLVSSPEFMLTQTEYDLNVSNALILRDSTITKSPIKISAKRYSRLITNETDSYMKSNEDDNIQEMEFCEEDLETQDAESSSEKEDNDIDFDPESSELISESTSECLDGETNSSGSYETMNQQHNEKNGQPKSIDKQNQDIAVSFSHSNDKSSENINPDMGDNTKSTPEPNSANRSAITSPRLDIDSSNKLRRKETLSNSFDVALQVAEVMLENQEVNSSTYSENKDQATQTNFDEEIFNTNSPFGLVMIYDNYLSKIPSKIIFSSFSNDVLNL